MINSSEIKMKDATEHVQHEGHHCSLLLIGVIDSVKTHSALP